MPFTAGPGPAGQSSACPSRAEDRPAGSLPRASPGRAAAVWAKEGAGASATTGVRVSLSDPGVGVRMIEAAWG